MEHSRMLDLSDLNAFARIADLGNMSAAARALNSPKSSISRSLSRLEIAAGAPLVERSTRHLRLTDAGHLMLRHARRILDDVGDAENAMSGFVGMPRGTLRVSTPFTFAAGPLAPLLPGFLARYPEVRVVLIVDNRMIDLQTEEVDVAIRIGPLQSSDLIARRIATYQLWVCASPQYLKQQGTPESPDELSKHRLIAHADRRSGWRFKASDGAVVEVDVVPGCVVPEPAVVRTMLLGGAGIGQLPDFAALDAIADGSLVRLFPDHDVDTVDAHALYTSHRSMSAKLRVFIDALIAGASRPVKDSPRTRPSGAVPTR